MILSVPKLAPQYNKPTAVAAAVVLHLLVLAILVQQSTAGGRLYTSLDTLGQSDFEGVAVDMINPDAKAETEVSEPATNEKSIDQTLLDAIAEQVIEPSHVDGLKPVSETRKPTPSIIEALDNSSHKQQEAAAPAAKASLNKSTLNNDANTKAVSGLWEAIEPCWKRLVDKDTLAVELEISFDANGRLSKPPVINRAVDQSATPEMLRSEFLAITALAQCGPYAAAKGQEAVAVDFVR